MRTASGFFVALVFACLSAISVVAQGQATAAQVDPSISRRSPAFILVASSEPNKTLPESAAVSAPRPAESQESAAPANVLIVFGTALTPSYGNANIEKVWFDYASSFSDALQDSLGRANAMSQIHTNRDRKAKVSDEVAKALGERSYTALVQVSIDHVKNGSENTVYLQVEHFRVRYSATGDGKTVTFENRQVRRYPILGEAGKDMRDVPASRLADQFVQDLKVTGAL